MPTNATRGQESTATEPTITGPHTGYDRYGRPDHTFYRCERCGTESVDRTLADAGCWNCGAGGREAR